MLPSDKDPFFYSNEEKEELRLEKEKVFIKLAEQGYDALTEEDQKILVMFNRAHRATVFTLLSEKQQEKAEKKKKKKPALLVDPLGELGIFTEKPTKVPKIKKMTKKKEKQLMTNLAIKKAMEGLTEEETETFDTLCIKYSKPEQTTIVL